MVAANILIVDDDSLTARVVGLILEEHGYEVAHVSDGDEAVRRFTEFDLVIMDCGLPTLDGFEATARIRATEAGRTIPIIALTSGRIESERRCLDAGMNAFLMKPVQPNRLIHQVERWLDYPPTGHSHRLRRAVP